MGADRVSIIRETVRDLGDDGDGDGDGNRTKLSSSAAFERIQRLLLASSTDSQAVDEVYEQVMLSATDVLTEDYEGFGQCVDLLKRALLRHLPSYEQLQRVNVWCEFTVRNVNSRRAETSKAKEEEEEGVNGNATTRTRSQSQPTERSDTTDTQGVLLVNSLKFLKRLVGRHIDTLKEQQKTSSDEGEEEEEEMIEDDGYGGIGGLHKGDDEAATRQQQQQQSYPHSALSQLYGNMDNARRRSSSHEILAQMQSRNHQSDATASSIFNKNNNNATNTTTTSGGGALGRSEEEQNRMFSELLEDRDRSVGELSESVRLVLTHIMEMYERDPQQTFVVVSIFLQEMLMENTVAIQRRAFDIFLNLVYHWQKCVALSNSNSDGVLSAALGLRDAMWHTSLLNEMCLVLLDCGMEVDQSVWKCAHACILFCCAKEGLLVPKLVKIVSFEILKQLLKVCHTHSNNSDSNSEWSPACEGTIISMVTSHILPYRGNHLGVDANALQLIGGEREVVRLMRDLRSPSSLANLLCVAYFIVCHALNGPAITLSGEHMMNSNMNSLTSLLQSGLHLRLSEALNKDEKGKAKQELSSLGSALEREKKYPKQIVDRLIQFFQVHHLHLQQAQQQQQT